MLIGWMLVGLWALIFLASAKPTLRRLPAPSAVVPPYVLWLPDGGDAPDLDPEPDVVIRGATPPADGPDRVLVLGPDTQVPVDLPGRLMACGVDFVSVFPQPTPGLIHALSAALERLRRDVANPTNVVNPKHPAGFADDRCAWLRRTDLALPGLGEAPVLRASRARKAHGLTVDLREGRTHDGPAVTAPGRTLGEHREHFDELVGSDSTGRVLLIGFPILLNATPFLLLLTDAWQYGALALGLGTAARGMTALREGFGGPLTVLGWVIEPVVALASIGARRLPQAPFPTVPDSAPPSLTAAASTEGGAWLDAAGVPFLARRLGGSGPVMAQIYSNAPTGTSFLGRAIDRAVHASPAARSVRFRRLAVARAAQRLEPQRLMSVPCGSAPDVSLVDAPHVTLVDPDPAARALAQLACPNATVVDGTIEHGPAGPFDVIIYAGLAEYLDDAEVVRHFQHLRARLDEGGLLITTTTAEHPQRNRMTRWIGWHTRARTPDSLAELLDVAGFVVEVRVGDPLGIQWVLTARARRSE